MLSGYLDDSSSSPWGELKKGLIDFVIALMAAFTYLHYNPNTFELAFFSKTVTLHPLIYGFLIVVLIWVSINVTNCSDGVDGLCGTLSAACACRCFPFPDELPCRALQKLPSTAHHSGRSD